MLGSETEAMRDRELGVELLKQSGVCAGQQTEVRT